MKRLVYFERISSNKTLFQKARHITETEVYNTNLVNKMLGSLGNELSDVTNGIQDAINRHPRINIGFLYSYLKVRRYKESVQVVHSATGKVICEVFLQEGGEI